jgi:thiol-disulfide isomerase/thioredoxin
VPVAPGEPRGTTGKAAGRLAAFAVSLGAALLVGCHSVRLETPRLASYLSALPADFANEHRLEFSQIEGRVVLVVFIATWCFPCLADLVSLAKLERTFAAEDFAIVMVGMDLEGRRVLTPFSDAYALKFPLIVADEPVRNGETPFGRIRELPSRVLFGRDGELVAAYSGVARHELLEETVRRAVERRR